MIKSFVYGGLSAIPEIGFTHWLDVGKTTQQDIHQNTGRRIGFINTLKYIKNNNGFIGFNRGIIPRFYGGIPMKIMFWGVEDYAYRSTSSIFKNDLLRKTFSGVCGGIAITFIDTPIEIKKVRKITSGSKIGKKDIIRSFYPNLYRNISFCGVFFPLLYSISNKEETFYQKCLKGGIAGAVASAVSQPFDVVKTEIQKRSTNIGTVRLISEYVVRDPTLLFSGGLMRLFHTCAKMSVGYMTISYLYSLDQIHS